MLPVTVGLPSLNVHSHWLIAPSPGVDASVKVIDSPEQIVSRLVVYKADGPLKTVIKFILVIESEPFALVTVSLTVY